MRAEAGEKTRSSSHPTLSEQAQQYKYNTIQHNVRISGGGCSTPFNNTMNNIEDTLTLVAVDLFLEGATSTDSQDPTGDSSRSRSRPLGPWRARSASRRTMRAEVETLRERLAELEAERGDGNARLTSKVMQNMRMRQHIIQHANHMAGLQSMLSSYQASGAYGALETYINLTAESDHRRRSLLELKAQKIPGAHAYITERIRHMDVSRPHFAVKQFKTPEGHLGFSHFDITPFEVQTLRGVTDALRYFFDHQEMNISKNLGLITIRESDDNEGDPVLQCCLVSTLPTGGELETNMAMFVEYCEHKDSSEDSYGLVTLDYINHDELFPYQPDFRSRLDLHNVIFVTPVHSSESSEPIIALVRACAGRIRCSANSVSRTMENVAQDLFIRFGQVMVQAVQDRLGVR